MHVGNGSIFSMSFICYLLFEPVERTLVARRWVFADVRTRPMFGTPRRRSKIRQGKLYRQFLVRHSSDAVGVVLLCGFPTVATICRPHTRHTFLPHATQRSAHRLGVFAVGTILFAHSPSSIFAGAKVFHSFYLTSLLSAGMTVGHIRKCIMLPQSQPSAVFSRHLSG